MDPLSISASVIAILQLTSKVIEYLHDVKDAPKDWKQCAIEASNLNSLLIQLKFRLEERSDEAWYAAVQTLSVEHGPLDQYKHALEQLQSKTRGSGIKKVGNALTWTFRKEEVASVLSRIERLKSLVQVALEMDHLSVSWSLEGNIAHLFSKLSQAMKSSIDTIDSNTTAMKHDTNNIKQSIPALETGIKAIRQEHVDQRRDIILEWISSTNFPAQQSDFIAQRQEGTGEWFLDSSQFAEWVHGSNHTLFCPGMPGAGKTMMTAIVIDHLLREVQSDTIGVAYIYCNYKAQEDSTATTLLAAILKQLARARPIIAEPIERLYDDHFPHNTRPSLEEISKTLQSVLANYSSVYVAVDALDELPDTDGSRSRLLAKLHDLQSKANLRLMVTSRFIPDIENKFGLIPWLEVRANDEDVKAFVRGQVFRLPNCVQRNGGLQRFVEDKIVEAVDGMFLLARLHIDSLLDKRTKSKVQSTLEKLSKGPEALHKAYDDAITRIEGQLPDDRALAKSVLSWITYAQRPLTTEELCHALAVEVGKEELDLGNIPDVEDVVSVCAGLVTVDEESNIIRLVHYTTQEYFEQIREDWIPSAQQEIASTCLTYLCYHTFRSGSCASRKNLKTRVEQNVFLDYAACHWGLHAQEVQEEVSEIALYLLQDDNLVSSAHQIVSVSVAQASDERIRRLVLIQTTGLHLTARFGLLHLSEKLLPGSGGNVMISADSEDQDGLTPLWCAARNGHEAVVKLLVERDDVEANCEDRYGQTPLSWAARRGHEAMVKLLVERDDVEADRKDQDGQTPLSWAASLGHEAVVKLLVERDDVEADRKNRYGQTPLSWAASIGHEALVKLLVERDDVEADCEDQDGQTPLSWAASLGHEAVVKLLVERDDVEADRKDRYGQTLLSWAARKGHEAVVKLLVERDDVEADRKDQDGQTPLSWAASLGHEAVVKLLLERDDVKADSKD